MHQNDRFNIAQHNEVNSRLFVVIEGQRTGSGHLAPGAKVLTQPMSRDDAIELADKMEREVPMTPTHWTLDAAYNAQYQPYENDRVPAMRRVLASVKAGTMTIGVASKECLILTIEDDIDSMFG